VPLPKIQARIEKLISRLEDSKINADEVPAILDAAWDLVEVTIAATMDRRLTFAEVGAIWSSITALRAVIAAARQD
tara:strand:+ start:3172 stop:3399 length:228 start_codon:yes stop_codon:yes gene_type:complete